MATTRLASNTKNGSQRYISAGACALCGRQTGHQVGAKIAGKKYKFCSRSCRSEVKRGVGELYGR